jgi:hypothetical protein
MWIDVANNADEEKRSSSRISPSLVLELILFAVRQLRRDIQRWLAPPDPSTNHNIARKAHYQGTAAWFFEGSMFGEWKSSPSLLWVHGKRTSYTLRVLHTSKTQKLVAGSGKSVLWYVVFHCYCLY